MEIIEETIRYIDALHHQLASRLHESDRGQGNSSKREGGEPLRPIDAAFEPSTRAGDDTAGPSTSSPSTNRSEPPPSGQDQETDTKALKEAVENIQRLFSVHLLQQDQGSNDDELDSGDT